MHTKKESTVPRFRCEARTGEPRQVMRHINQTQSVLSRSYVQRYRLSLMTHHGAGQLMRHFRE